MNVVIDIDPTQVQFEEAQDGEPAQLRLALIGKNGQIYNLAIEGRALLRFAEIFRALQTSVPGALGGH